jgi:hypothetical protein
MTLIEVVISLVIFSLLSVILDYVMTSSRKAEEYLAAVGRATEQGRRLSLKLSGLVEASRVIFQRDAVGRGYLGAMDLSRDPPDAGARLPLVDEGRPLGPDVDGDPRTGNVLCFVREGDPAQCVADAGSGTMRDMTLHRFVCIYPHQTARMLVASGPAARDLVIWRSVTFASYSEVTAIQNAAEQTSVLQDLFTRIGVTHAWDESAPVGQAFYAIAAGGSLAGAPDPNPVIAEDPTLSDRGRLVYRNVQLASTEPSNVARRAVLTVDPLGGWVPNGFELKIGGTATSRQVWIHLVVESPAAVGQGVAVFPSTVIANAQEF